MVLSLALLMLAKGRRERPLGLVLITRTHKANLNIVYSFLNDSFR